MERTGVIESLTPVTAAQFLAVAFVSVPEHQLATMAQRRESQRLNLLANRIDEVHNAAWESGDCAAPMRMARAGLKRKVGQFREAVELSRSIPETWHGAVAEGLALREAGDIEGALTAFQRACEAEPDNVSSYLEAADGLFDRQEWDRAKQEYQRALDCDPTNAWAKASWHWCSWKLDQDSKHVEAMKPLWNETDTRRVHQLFSSLWSYSGYLPEPNDATANILRQLMEQQEPLPNWNLKLTLSHLDAPSNLLAVKLEAKARGIEANFDITVERIPSPDPRLPLRITAPGFERPDISPLWRFQGTTPEPGLPVPPPELCQLIAELASEPFDNARNWARASEVAETIGPDAGLDLLGVMVHPPELPDGWTALSWLPRVQLVVAQTIAHLDFGWEHSVRRRLLMSVLFGPGDWATEAAIIALALLASEDAEAAADIRWAFRLLEQNRPKSGYCTWLHALYWHASGLPDISDDERKRYQAERGRLEEQ